MSIGDFVSAIGGISTALYPYNKSEGLMNQLEARVPTYLGKAQQITDQAVNEAQFTPFTVSTGSGTVDVGEGGSISQQLSGQGQALQSGLLGSAVGLQGSLGSTVPDTTGLAQQGVQGASTALSDAFIQDQGLLANRAASQNLLSGAIGDVGGYAGQAAGLTNTALSQAQSGLAQAAPSAQSIYDQIRGMQSPEEERQRLELENRLAAQGRLGVSTAAYGGTPEQLALAKAQEEARNAAAYQAINQADALATSQQARAMNLGQLGLSGLSTQQGMTSQDIQNVLGLQQADVTNAQALQALQTGNLNLGAGMFNIGQQATALPSTVQSQELQNLQAMLGAAYTPEQQSLAALSAASPYSQLATSAALSRAEQLSAGGQYGLEAMIGGDQTLANLEAARSQALAESLKGMFSATGNATSSIVGGAVDSIVDFLTPDTTTG